MERTLKGRERFGTLLVAALAAFIFALVAASGAWAQQKNAGPTKVYRWVDENGEVHYSETLPPNWEGETHDELGHDGIVREEDVSHAPKPAPPPKKETTPGKTELPRDKSGMKRPDPLYTDAEKQDQLDRMLLLRFRSEEELMEAMNVEINQLMYDERLLSATRDSLQASLRSHIEVAGNRQRAGLEIKDETRQEMTRIRNNLAENERSLRGLKMREEQVRERFERDVQRYRELVELYSETDGR